MPLAVCTKDQLFPDVSQMLCEIHKPWQWITFIIDLTVTTKSS